MSLRKMFTQPLTIQAVGTIGADSIGDEVVGPTNPAIPVLGYLEQISSAEYLIDRDTTITQWKVYLPAGTVIDRNDYINFNSQIFQVSGEPHYAYNPRKRTVTMIICKLVEVQG